MPKRDYLVHNALQLIFNSRDHGGLQSERWQKLGATSRDGSRIALKLEKKGLMRARRDNKQPSTPFQSAPAYYVRD